MGRVVVTPRLTLRPFLPDDEAAYAAIRAKPETARYLAGGEAGAAKASAEAAATVRRLAELWDTVGYGPWAAVARDDGRLLGHAGLRRLPEHGGETEILYLFDSTVWGAGLATEAASAARDFAFGEVGLTRVIGFALPENVGSIRVLERIGMRPDGPVEAFGMQVLRFVLDRS